MDLSYNNKKYNVEISQTKDVIATIDGVAQQDMLTALNKNIIHIQSDSGNMIAYCADDKDHFYINIEARMFVFDKVKAESAEFGTDSTSSGNIDILKPSMPGSVVNVLVQTGQEVNEGDGLITLEAMKMEITLFASISGTVKEVNVSKGEQVDTDKVLIIVEKITSE